MSHAEPIPVAIFKDKEVDASSSIELLFDAQKKAFALDRYPSYESRVRDLKRLKTALLANKNELLTALERDFLYRSHDETLIGDIFTSTSAIEYTLKNLKSWMKPQRRKVGMVFQPASANIHYQPLGVVGIIAPWNYPVFLTLGPLVAAIAAGNRAMIKVSEFTPQTNMVLMRMLASVFERNKVCVIEGEAKTAAFFSSLPFDHLLFTGSTQVGRQVMKAAANNLVPVTLELGGKSPVIIDGKISMNAAVKRFIYGKTLNAGQTCVAPDYIYCPEPRINELVEAIKKQYESMYPSALGCECRTRIINTRQFNRLQGYLDDAKAKGAKVVALGKVKMNGESCFMPLTLVLNATSEMTVMQEEIFGPILPILGYSDVQAVINGINENPRPLGLYIQSHDKQFQDRILTQTHAGGVCINDAAFQVVMDDLPFGGVGASGIGSYHGVEGFRTFSHAKSVLSRGHLFFGDMLFPPYGKAFHRMFYKLFIGHD